MRGAVIMRGWPDWFPAVEFPWWIMFGTIVTFSVAVCFRAPAKPQTAPA